MNENKTCKTCGYSNLIGSVGKEETVYCQFNAKFENPVKGNPYVVKYDKKKPTDTCHKWIPNGHWVAEDAPKEVLEPSKPYLFVYLALPMTGRSGEAVYKEAQSMRSWIQARYPDQVVDVLNWGDILYLKAFSEVTDGQQNPLRIMSQCLEKIAKANIVAFSNDGWKHMEWFGFTSVGKPSFIIGANHVSRGCVLERTACELYSIPTVVVPRDVTDEGGF